MLILSWLSINCIDRYWSPCSPL